MSLPNLVHVVNTKINHGMTELTGLINEVLLLVLESPILVYVCSCYLFRELNQHSVYNVYMIDSIQNK